jgi:hypothetical protein
MSFRILSCWFGKSVSISSSHSKLRSLVGMSFLNQLTYIVFLILSANTRRCNQKISFHHDLYVLWVPHHYVLCFKDFFHLVSFSICLVLQNLYLVLEATSWLLFRGILWVAQLVVIPSLSFTLGLEPKVPDCAGFQYMKLAFNPRSILLNPCVNDLSLAQYVFPFKLVVVVLVELWQQRTFPSTSYGSCSLMEPNGSRQEFSVWVSPLCLWLCHTFLSALVYMRCELVHPNLRNSF